ncbi:MAG: AraC family transcriptional regulator [Caldilineaceae bacterium]|nr:AraC family transcriptional regulator [Caldilineaceae bacterium]
MQILTPAEIRPVVRIANYHRVAPGQSWPNRSIPDLQLILAVEGEYLYLEQNNPPLPVLAGSVLWIEPGRRHTFCAVSAEPGLITGMHLELAAVGAWAAGDYRMTPAPEPVTVSTDVDYLHNRFKRLAAVFDSYTPYRSEQTSAIASEIVFMLAGYWRKTTSPARSPRMELMIRYIRANLRQPLSRRELGRAFGITPEHVNVLFRKELGMTPAAVINRERVLAAYRMLHEQGCSVKEAAYAVGYNDPLYFSRVFKMVFGVSPSLAR